MAMGHSTSPNASCGARVRSSLGAAVIAPPGVGWHREPKFVIVVLKNNAI